MALIEVQIRTDRVCKLIEGEINSQPLSAPKLDRLEIAGNLLERIECKDCTLTEPWADDVISFESKFVFHHYTSLQAQVRPAGSFGAGAPLTLEKPVFIGLRMKGDNGNWRIEFELFLGRGILSFRKGVFPINLPAGITIAAAELIENGGLVAIRIATDAADLTAPVVNKLGAAEWCQTVPGELIAEEIRRILDSAIDDAVRPPPQPESWEWWKPKPKNDLRKDGATGAVWFAELGRAVAQGNITAVDQCPLTGVDVGIQLTLAVQPQAAPGNMLRTVAKLTWDADTTWCWISVGIVAGFPVGITVAVLAGNKISETILGKHISGGGFQEIARDDDFIAFEQIAGPPPPPSREFEITALAVVPEGIQTSGTIKPKVRAKLEGSATPPGWGLSIDCNARSVGVTFHPAEVLLWSVHGDKSRPDVKPKPLVFVNEVTFEPPNAWKIEAKDYLKSAAASAPGDVLLVLSDPDAGRLPPGTATSMYLPTNLGVRWVDLGTIPAKLQLPEGAERLMNKRCDAISNPWAEGLTQLAWVDPLVDPDYEHRDRFRFWALGMRGLPPDARIEFVATSADGKERLMGVVEGMTEAVLELLTSPTETLAFRVDKAFHAPRPTVARGWFMPTKGINHEEYVRDNLLEASAPAASDSERMARQGRTRVDWATTTRLKTGERFLKHGTQLVVGVIRGVERIQ